MPLALSPAALLLSCKATSAELTDRSEIGGEREEYDALLHKWR